MDEIISHLRDVAACRKAADELRAKQLAMMQYLRDLNTEIEDIETKAARAIETIADLNQRIEELGQ